jgi:FlaG/FlaF family flagellin (archaellin)
MATRRPWSAQAFHRPSSGPRRMDQQGVSSVVGTVLMLGVTMAVFAGLALVVLGYYSDADEQVRADLAVERSSRSLQLTHGGGEPVPLATGHLLVNRAGQEVRVPLTSFANQPGLSDGTWNVGDSLCIQGPGCLYPLGSDVRGVLLISGNSLLLEEGVRAHGSSSTGSSTGPAGQPDLTVAHLSKTPADPGAGESVTFTARVTNGGTAAAGASVLHFRIDGTTVATASLSSLAAGASVDVTSSPAWVATSGSRTLLLVADATSMVSESNEANNQATHVFTVGAGVSDPGQPFRDTNGDGLYTPGTDVLIPTAQVTDCQHSESEGLVIPSSVGSLSATSCRFTAGKNLVIAAPITTTTGNIDLEGKDVTVLPGLTLSSGANLDIVNDRGTFVGSGATFLARGTIAIGAPQGGHAGILVNLANATVSNTAAPSDAAVTIYWETGDMDGRGVLVDAKGSLTIGGTDNGHKAGNVLLSGSTLRTTAAGSDRAITFTHIAGSITATGSATQWTAKGALTVAADGGVNLSGATLSNTPAGSDSTMSLQAGTTLNLTGTQATAKGAMVLQSGGAMALANAVLSNTASGSDRDFTASSGGALSGAGLQVQTKGVLTVTAPTVDLTNAVLSNVGAGGSPAITLTSTTGALTAAGAQITGKGNLVLTAATGLTLTGAVLDNTGNGASATGAFTSNNGALSAANVQARTRGNQVWKASNAGIVLDGSTLATGGSSHLVACLATSTGQVSVGGTLTFSDSNGRLDVQRASDCGTNAYSATYITPWNASTQGKTE